MSSKLISLIILYIITFQFQNTLSLIENNIVKKETANIELDQYVSGSISNLTEEISNYYKISLLNNTEKILIDWQSEYGCIYINVGDTLPKLYSTHFVHCSNEVNSIYSLNKNEILEKYGDENKTTLENVDIILGIGIPPFEISKNSFINYSFKVSSELNEINIIKINSDYKYICNLEKILDNKFRCIFIVVNTEINKNIILYSTSNNNLSISANLIDKEKYDNLDINYLIDNIPNSTYSQYSNKDKNFIFISQPSEIAKKYLYISIESNLEELIEFFVQSVTENYIKIPEINKYQFYKITDEKIHINLNLTEEEISFNLISLNGKASIYLDNNKFNVDDNSNKLILNLKNECNLNIENSNTDEYGFIFYINYFKKSNLNEINNEKINHLLFINNNFPLMMYTKIKDIKNAINININFYNLSNYNLSESSFIFEITFISLNELYQIKKYNSLIKTNNDLIRGTFNPYLLLGNIYLTPDEINKFNIEQNPFILININKNFEISNNNNDDLFEKIIFDISISQNNNLNIQSEKIYHFGKLNDDIVHIYKLGYNNNYKYMNIEFSFNNALMDFSIRTNNDGLYQFNDTRNIKIISSQWANGRELLTIENSCDYYLNIFIRKKSTDTRLTNYVFKYVNSNNTNNYIIIDEQLTYNSDKNQIIFNNLQKNLTNEKITYYLKLVKSSNYIESEAINTIAFTESKNNAYKLLNYNNNETQLIFPLNELELGIDYTYYVNIFACVIDNDNDIEYVSYGGKKIIINSEIDIEEYNGLILRLIIYGIIAGGLLLVIIILCFLYREYSKYIKLHKEDLF